MKVCYCSSWYWNLIFLVGCFIHCSFLFFKWVYQMHCYYLSLRKSYCLNINRNFSSIHSLQFSWYHCLYFISLRSLKLHRFVVALSWFYRRNSNNGVPDIIETFNNTVKRVTTWWHACMYIIKLIKWITNCPFTLDFSYIQEVY